MPLLLYAALRRILFLLPPETAHAVAMAYLRLRGALPAAAPPELPITVAGLRFPNPVGVAAGFDKDGVAVAGLFALGFGAVEVGTLTPRPQPGNPRPRLFRRPPGELVNRMGFNNGGAAAAARRLAALGPRPGPVGVNVGKNKDTPLDDAVSDYVACVETVAGVADYLVVNASSPNTPGLRTLQAPERMAALLAAVRARTDKPLFVKIGPDLAPEDLDALVDVAVAAGARGIIATNTRPLGEGQGGLSGVGLREQATAVLRRAYLRAAGRLALVGVGGIATAADAYARIRSGASLVQVYTGFIYEGPGIARALVSGVRQLLDRDGLRSVEEAVGLDARKDQV